MVRTRCCQNWWLPITVVWFRDWNNLPFPFCWEYGRLWETPESLTPSIKWNREIWFYWQRFQRVKWKLSYCNTSKQRMLLKVINKTGKNMTNKILQQKRCFPFSLCPIEGLWAPATNCFYCKCSLFEPSVLIKMNEVSVWDEVCPDHL